jgi:hypothetical protein
MAKIDQGEIYIPDELIQAHNLCFLNHDILVELLRSGEQQKVFWQNMPLRDEKDRRELEEAADVFEWLEATGRKEERKLLLRRVVFPALLSDFLHFIYEALECSRKAKLNVTYALLRKPIQENLFVFETIAADLEQFSDSMVNNPVKLHSQTAGGISVHANRIRNVLNIIGEDHRFDADYLAQLRYDKNTEDGFDGVSNKAIHLFTHHHAIQTEALNINFIFSGSEAKLTQWHYLYSRLPYILFYSRRLIEYICSTFVKTYPEYLDDLERRTAASTLLWAAHFEETYRQEAIERFIEETRKQLNTTCREAGYREPTVEDLIRMEETGAFPEEALTETILRGKRYTLLSRLMRKAAKAARNVQHRRRP